MELSEVKFPIVRCEPLYHRIKEVDKFKRSTILDSHKAIVNEEGKIINIVSKNYTLIQHEDFINDVIEMIPVEFGEQEPNLWISQDGAKMTLDIKFPDIVADIGDGDMVNPKLELRHSHNGLWAMDLLLGAFRIKCSNGLVIGKQIFHKVKKHTGQMHFPHLKEEFKRGMDEFFIQAETWSTWRERLTPPEDYEQVITTCAFGKRALDAIEKTVEIESKQTIDDLKLMTLSYWIFYNIITQYVTHKVKSRIRQAEYQARMRRIFR